MNKQQTWEIISIIISSFLFAFESTLAKLGKTITNKRKRERERNQMQEKWWRKNEKKKKIKIKEEIRFAQARRSAQCNGNNCLSLDFRLVVISSSIRIQQQASNTLSNIHSLSLSLSHSLIPSFLFSLRLTRALSVCFTPSSHFF